MVDILIENAYVITIDEERRSIPKGAVAISGNQIIDVGTTNSLNTKYKKNAETIINAKGKVLLPGFINTHSHLFQTFMRSLGDDMVILDWWPHTVQPMAIVMKPEDVYYANLVGCAESIKSGVTTVLDNHYIKPRWELSDQTFEAWKKIGIRGIQATNAPVADPWNIINDQLIKNPKEDIKDLKRLYRKYHGKANGRLNVWSGTGAPFTVTNEYMEDCAYTTKELGVGMVGHFHESSGEVDTWKEEHDGKSPIEYYHDLKLGLWCSRMISIHSVVLSEEDRRIFAKTDTRISHNVPSNMYLSSGVAPVPDLLKRGVTVSLGLDGPASNNGQDMMFCLKATVLLHKVHSLDPTIMTAEKALEMATIDGAKAIGMEDKLGSIEKGKIADLILLNPWMTNMMPIHRLESQIVYCGKAENIDTVIIDGNIVLENRQFKTINEQEVIKKAQELVDNQVERAGDIPQGERKRKWQSFATDRVRKW